MPKNLLRLLLFFGCLKILIHFFANANYGFHADELYYVALSRNLQWGYLDNAPLISLLSRASALLFGESLFAYRILPTLFSAATVCLTGFATYRLDGKSTAISVACLAMVFSPAYLASSYFLQPIAFEQFFWTLAAVLLLMFLQTEKNTYIYLFSATIGIGFLNKYTILLWLLALFLGLFFTKNLRLLKWKTIFISIVIFIVIILPNLIWQIQHGFPVFNYLNVVKSNTNFRGFGAYIFQFTVFHASGIAVWLAGLIFFITSRTYRNYSLFSIAALLVFCSLLLLKGKIYYTLGTFPILFAAGGVCWEMMLSKIANFLKNIFYLILILPSLIALPIVVPILSFNLTINYLSLMKTYTDIYQPLIWEDGYVHSLPQTYADMLGWEHLADKVQTIYNEIDVDERKNTLILTNKYFVTGALQYYLKHGKEKIIAPNNSFAIWSPQKLNAKKVIYVSLERDFVASNYAVRTLEIDTLNYPNSRINGAHIYLLDDLSELLKSLYKNERDTFYQEK